MKKTIAVLGLLLVTSANAAEGEFVDVQMFDTTVRTTLGQSEYTSKGCTIVQYGPDEGMVIANTFPRANCESIKSNVIDVMKKNHVGVYSFMINGVEVMKGIKP